MLNYKGYSPMTCEVLLEIASHVLDCTSTLLPFCYLHNFFTYYLHCHLHHNLHYYPHYFIPQYLHHFLHFPSRPFSTYPGRTCPCCTITLSPASRLSTTSPYTCTSIATATMDLPRYISAASIRPAHTTSSTRMEASTALKTRSSSGSKSKWGDLEKVYRGGVCNTLLF